ncbi:unnamed protein product [Callosobruchus maculatus]|uniref:Uncharacterized protein n=1 Tax=Callosobruchus maculatus TaxID=64391 RepID=A0A653BV89_CALMS|nr:unnamed protein product [Callosobruchus maculatus]
MESSYSISSCFPLFFGATDGIFILVFIILKTIEVVFPLIWTTIVFPFLGATDGIFISVFIILKTIEVVFPLTWTTSKQLFRKWQ